MRINSKKEFFLLILNILEELEEQQLSYSYFNQLNKTCLLLLKQQILFYDETNLPLHSSLSSSNSLSSFNFNCSNYMNEYLPLKVYLNEVINCLFYFKYSLNDIRQQRGNHFGVFMPSKYQSELTNLSKFCNIITNNTNNINNINNTNQINPYELMISNNDINLAYLECIDDISTRLFWLCSFGSQYSVPWDDFIAAFIVTYDFKDMNLNLRYTFYQKLINSIHSNSEVKAHINNNNNNNNNLNNNQIILSQFISFDTHITVEMINKFTLLSNHPNHFGLYHSFQYHCDPHTLIYLTGVIDDSSEEQVLVPTIVRSLLGYHIIQIACGGQHAAILTNTGEIFSWGRGGFGRLGHGNMEPQATPKLIQGLAHKQCKQIACGFAYSAAVDVTGKIYTWGAGENGRLGLGDTADRFTPVLVTSLQHIVMDFVAAGSVHTCMKSQRGDIYSCGKFEYTGHGSNVDILLPTLLNCFGQTPIKQISVGPGGYHTIALTFDGQVYSWGHNRVGQLGYTMKLDMPKNNEGAYFLPTPRLVPLPSVADHYTSIGRHDIIESNTNNHSNNNNYYNENDLISQNSLHNIQSPIQIKQVMAGWGHSCLITTDGIGYVCGRNQHGQLGLGEQSKFPMNERNHYYQPYFQPILTFPYSCNMTALLSHEYLTLVSCGGEHTIFKTNKNKIYSTGRGNKGQLGHNNKLDENIPKEVEFFNELQRNILQIACGNSSTLYLIGRYSNPLSLFEQCLRVINENETSILGCDDDDENLQNSLQPNQSIQSNYSDLNNNNNNNNNNHTNNNNFQSKEINPTIQFIRSLVPMRNIE